MDITNKFDIPNKPQKQVIGEKNRSWWRTGLKIGGSILGAETIYQFLNHKVKKKFILEIKWDGIGHTRH